MLTKVWEADTNGNPDCIIKFQEGFVVATYTLDQLSSKKSGSLIYFTNNAMVSTIHIDYAGILDLKIYRDSILSCCSDGSILITQGENLNKIQITDSCCSFMALAENKVFCSSLDGSVHCLDLSTFDTKTSKYNPYEI